MTKGLFSPGPAYAILLCALLPFTLHASEPLHVFTGTLGNMPIVLELDLSDPMVVSGRYFYEEYHNDLPLSGVLSGKDLTLEEGLDDNSGKVLPELLLHQGAQSDWQGEWRGPEGKTLMVELTETQVPPPPEGAEAGWQTIYQQSPYDYLRLQGLPLQPDSVQTFMGYTLQWWTEPESKLSLFEITSGYTPEQRDRINQQLRARLWNEVVSYHACLLQGSRFGADFQQTVTPELLSPGIVSVNIFTRYNCGGAHPDFGDSPISVDVNTGKSLSLEDVLWIGKGKAFHYDDREDANGKDSSSVSFDTFSNYRNKQFAPWIVSQLKTSAPEKMKKPATKDQDCNFSDPSVWSFPAWYFKPGGLYFGPSFARVMRACESPEWSVVPYSEIKQHPGGMALDLPD